MLEYICAYLQLETRQIRFHKSDRNDLLCFLSQKDQLQDKSLNNEKTIVITKIEKLREEGSANFFQSNFNEFEKETFVHDIFTIAKFERN